MMKRLSLGSKEENYEHVLMCLICRSLFDDHDHQPKFLPCHHTFCKDCLRAYIRQMGDEIECPSCRKLATIPAAGVAALQTNFYVKYIQSLVHGGPVSDGTLLQCNAHPSHKLQYYCRDCSTSICKQCCEVTEKNNCGSHKKVPLTTITEEYHQKLDTVFSKANASVEHKKVELEGILKALSEEKDQALLNIESTFEQHIHTLTRRATLLKNKVIAIYNEQVETLEADLEEVSTAMTCIVSLKEYHENDISRGRFVEIDQGLAEMEEVHSNVSGKIRPSENHIVFEEKHGCDKYQACVKDLGRVRCRRPTIPRTEPEGNDAQTKAPAIVTPSSSNTDSDSSPTLSASLASSQPTIAEECSVYSPDHGMAGAAASVSHLLHTNTQRDTSPQQPTLPDTPNCGCENQPVLPLSSSGASSAVKQGHGLPQHEGPSAAIANGLNNNLVNGYAKQNNVAVNPVVRPKTLSSSPRKAKISTNNNIVKPIKGRRSLEGEDKLPMPPSLSAGLEACGGEGRPPSEPLLGYGGLDFGSNQTTPTAEPKLHLSDMDLQKRISPDRNPARNHIEIPDPNIELLKKTDKMYHHLVYTSYDEEELLKELKCGKVQCDLEQEGAARGERFIEDSDSWMTVSTSSDGSTISGNSDGEEYRYVHTDLDNEESTL